MMQKYFLLAMALMAGQLSAIPGFIEQKLQPNDATGKEVSFGHSLAVTDDGQTLVVGSSLDNNGIGAITLFKNQQDGWHQAGHKLVGADFKGTEIGQGVSVAISADGTRLATGGPDDDNKTGAVWIYDQAANGGWTQAAKLVALNVNGTGGSQGYSIALSGDGKTLVVGAPRDSGSRGVTFIFDKDGTRWTENAKLIGSHAIGVASQGASTSISADGNTVAIGAPYDENKTGAVYVFVRINGEWVQQSNKLRCLDITGDAVQGVSVSLSGDGNMLAIGARNDNHGDGSVCIFIRMGSQWIQQGNKFSGTDAVKAYPIEQGARVVLSRDGKTLLVGGSGDDSRTGALWRFKQIDNSGWVQQGEKIVCTHTPPFAQQGSRLAISAKGTTLVSAGVGSGAGDVVTFTQPEEIAPAISKDYYLSYWVPPLGAVVAGIIVFIIKYNLKKYCCRPDSVIENSFIPLEGPGFEVVLTKPQE